MTAIDFEVSEIVEPGIFWGRNGRVEIPLGSVFTSIHKIRVERMHGTMHTICLGEVSIINLQLQEIQWYRRSIAVVPGGHTAGLRLHGDGITELREALSQCAEHEYLHITGVTSGA